MSWSKTPPRVIAHRGAHGRGTPENTMAAFHAAVAAGAPAIELDVRLTRDGEVVVHHDPALGRVLPGSGAVEDKTVTEMRAAGAPTLREVLRAFPTLLVDVEIKADAANADRLPALVAALVREERAAERVLVSSFDPDLANECARMGDLEGGLIVPFPIEPADLADHPQLRHVMLVADAAVDGAVEPLVRVGLVVHVWTVNERALAESLWARGVSGVITDEPARLLRR